MNNESNDEDIDGFQRGSFNGSLIRSFLLCYELQVVGRQLQIAVQEFSTQPEASGSI